MLVDSLCVKLLRLCVTMRRPTGSRRAIVQKWLLARVSDSALAIAG